MLSLASWFKPVLRIYRSCTAARNSARTMEQMTRVTPPGVESPCLEDSKERNSGWHQRRQSQDASIPHGRQVSGHQERHDSHRHWMKQWSRHRSASTVAVFGGRSSHHTAAAGRWRAHAPVRLQERDPIPFRLRRDNSGFGPVPHYAHT